jgi:hypothetical protein
MNQLPPNRFKNTFTLAYCINSDIVEESISGFSITQSIKGNESLVAVNGCNSEWNILRSRGCLPSVEYAIIFATEEWGLNVSDWILYRSKPNESITASLCV